jgi:hypothetical protein
MDVPMLPEWGRYNVLLGATHVGSSGRSSGLVAATLHPGREQWRYSSKV